ncbi:MAG: hypothetical protein Q8Q09_00615 [Deltaproteobacteria bacterium]|nr:hypothetical protein [Deltaproteobacteria bacterium]
MLLIHDVSGLARKTLQVTALWAAVGLVGCATTTQVVRPTGPLQARDFMPLRRDAAWSYDAQDLTNGGPRTLVTLRVVAQNSGQYVVQQGVGSTANYSYAQGGILRNGETILAEPIVVGTSWQGMQGDTYSIRAVGLRRTTPAGTFTNVIEVARNGREGFVERTWYAHGVGAIESNTPVVVGQQIREFRLTLRGYTLNGEY